MYLIYLLNQEPRLEPFSRTKPGNHPLLTLIESQENNITDISLLVPKVSVNNAITLEKGIFLITMTQAVPNMPLFSYIDIHVPLDSR